MINPIRLVNVDRYITPLREGGSLPAIIEADDGYLYALKFHGAGQGSKALIADLIGAELARIAGFLVPETIFANLEEGFGRTEPDEEIQDLLKFSVGLNLGFHYLTGSISFDPLVHQVEATLAAKIVWFDAFMMNIDRTARNTNMLYWNKQLWLIDHGAALYFHHNPASWQEQSLKPFVAIKNHVLLNQAASIISVHEEMLQKINENTIEAIVALIPEVWLNKDPETNHQLYLNFLKERIQNAEIFVNEAENARKTLV